MYLYSPYTAVPLPPRTFTHNSKSIKTLTLINYREVLISLNLAHTTVPLKSKLPPFVSFLSIHFLFLARCVSFLSRITEAFSMAYITHKKPVLCNDCCSAVPCQIDGTVKQNMHRSFARFILNKGNIEHRT